MGPGSPHPVLLALHSLRLFLGAGLSSRPAQTCGGCGLACLPGLHRRVGAGGTVAGPEVGNTGAGQVYKPCGWSLEAEFPVGGGASRGGPLPPPLAP